MKLAPYETKILIYHYKTMDKIIEVIKHVFTTGSDTHIKICVPSLLNLFSAFIFIGFAIIIGVFKQHNMIAGVNCKSKKELAKIDLKYLCNLFGIITGIFGLILFITPFVLKYFEISKYNILVNIIGVLSCCAFLILFLNVIKKDRIFNNNKNV